MTELLHHRGPDDVGFFSTDGVSLGFRRLSIIDIQGGHQPMLDPPTGNTIVFNGEIFNFQQLRVDLESKGHRFSTRSDTEVLLKGYAEWGTDLPNHLVGMFAFAIWDSGKKTLFLVRDRLGIKPLFYRVDRDRLIFASEIKSILAFPETPRNLDSSSLEAFLTFLYVPGPETIFKGILHVPPGCTLEWKQAQVSVRNYWDIVPRPLLKASLQELAASLRKLVSESIRLRLISDVPLGVFLSGGIDSSIILYEMTQMVRPDQIRTYSIGFEGAGDGFNELADARLVAEHFGVHNESYVLDAGVTRSLPQITWHFDQPFANSTSVPLYYLSQRAKREITVALAGVGGDELFAGYPRNLAMLYASKYRRLPVGVRRGLYRIVNKLPESTTGKPWTRRAKEFARGSLEPPNHEYVEWVSCFKQDERKTLLADRPDDSNEIRKPEGAYIELQKIALGDPLSRAMYADLKIWLPYNLLEYGDKVNMAHAIENRVPLLDHRLVEFAFQIPSRFKVRGLTGKYLLRWAYRNELPKSTLRKRKAGFVAPLGYLYQTELKNLVQQILDPRQIKSHGMFDPTVVNRVLAQHSSGRRDRTNHLTALLIADLWHKMYIEETSLSKPLKSLAEYY